MEKQNVVILGGGVGGLAAGWMLSRTGEYRVVLVERAPVTGGVCATFREGDFLLDYGPHKCYSVIPGILDELRGLMGDEFLEHEKRNRIYLFDSFLEYPVRMAELALKMGPVNLFRCGMDMVGTTVKKVVKSPEPPSYEEYVIQRFGRRLYELVFEPLADKIWGDPATLSADIARTRIPSAGVVDVALRVMGLKKESEQTNAESFYYPRKGFGRIPERMAEEILGAGGDILTSTPPIRIDTDAGRVKAVHVEMDGSHRAIPTDLLISTLPFDVLVRLLGGESEPDLREALLAAEKLQYRAVFLVYVVLKRSRVTEDHWIFFPGKDLVFGRIFEQKCLSPEMVPQDRTVICCDFTDDAEGIYAGQSDDELGDRCVSDLSRIGLIEPAWMEKTFVRRFPKFYPRYDLHYKETISALYDSLKRYRNLLSTGRVGFYNYNNSDHCVDMGRFIADCLMDGKETPDIWSELEQRVANYRIVD